MIWEFTPRHLIYIIARSFGTASIVLASFTLVLKCRSIILRLLRSIKRLIKLSILVLLFVCLKQLRFRIKWQLLTPSLHAIKYAKFVLKFFGGTCKYFIRRRYNRRIESVLLLLATFKVSVEETPKTETAR